MYGSTCRYKPEQQFFLKSSKIPSNEETPGSGSPIDVHRREIVMRLYFAAIAISVGSVVMIVNACMFHDSDTRQSPVNIAHLR